MDPRELLSRLARGQYADVRFADAVGLAAALGFELKRTRGSHHIFARTGVRELLNLQEVDGDAKPYQLRQLMRLVERYNLVPEP